CMYNYYCNLHFIYFSFLSILFFAATSPSHISPLSLHDALPILLPRERPAAVPPVAPIDVVAEADPLERLALLVAVDAQEGKRPRSEEHTSELQSPYDLVCRLLLEKKKDINKYIK